MLCALTDAGYDLRALHDGMNGRAATEAHNSVAVLPDLNLSRTNGLAWAQARAAQLPECTRINLVGALPWRFA
jgi:DNA-binding response OmpR family regulator